MKIEKILKFFIRDLIKTTKRILLFLLEAINLESSLHLTSETSEKEV